MFLKIIGSLMVIGASVLLGYMMSRNCSRRPQELRELQGLLQMFENEISFLSNLLTDAFEKISNRSSGSVSGIFRETAQYLKNDKSLNASEAWNKALESNNRIISLDKEDLQILRSFGKMLGNSDLDGQIKNIRLVLTQLKLQEQKAEESRKKNESMYRNLGILGGLAIIVIFI